MMASVGVRYGADRFLNLRSQSASCSNQPHPAAGPCSVSFSANIGRFPRCKRGRIVSMSMRSPVAMSSLLSKPTSSDSSSSSTLLSDNTNNNKKSDKAVVHEKLEAWLKDSVGEIVKNLREAPLLVHVYNGGGNTTLKTEKAVEGEWPVVMERWDKREAPLPEGLIFVDRLEEEEEEEMDHHQRRQEEEEEEEEEKEERERQNGNGITRAWGIVVQGRGVDCAPVCYLLKTSRVGCGGVGLCCTHFCLTKVKSFRETTRSQLKNCWLVQGW